MTRPDITFSWQINLGHILIVISTLSAGMAAYIDLRRDIVELGRGVAAAEARIESAQARVNANDVTIATLAARFGSIEELMREVRNELRESRTRDGLPPRP